ncbi:MAG: transpeptidase family protein [Myxococcota bacterium]|nr:transpeptidase family protein [Myxococcota bacterium]
MKNLDPRRARWIRMRMGLLCGVMGVALGGVVSSAWRVQVEDGPEWRETAEKQRQRRLHIEPKRGIIHDRNGTPLAVSVEVPSVSADVVEMLRGVDGKAAQDALLREAAARLGQALSLPPAELFAKLEPRHRFLWVKRRVTSEEALAVRELGDPRKSPGALRGLSIEGEGHRYYPGRELAGAVLGFVAPDGQGKDGIELALNDDLRGKIEDMRGLRDRGGRLIFEAANDEHSLQGNDVVLSIDEGIQRAAERELDAAMRTYETRGASLVVVDPSTGDILAMANVPGYNPNDYTDSQPDARRDRAVTDRFEPGSVMKTFTLAAALAAGTLKPTDAIDCEHGVYRIGGITVHDTHSNGVLSPTQILARSSNIGALKIGLQLGEAGLYAALRRFGFGEPTGVPLPGEAAGVLRPRSRSWYDAETASASFGQGISVTTLQLAMAMAAVANDGKLLEPVLVKKVSDGHGDALREVGPKVRREVVPPGVAKTLAEMLTAVTEEGGTAVEAAIPGFRVAGKTSTAQKVDPSTGRYSTEKYTAVFVGFVPVDHPRIVVAVVLDEPMIGRYGGDLAGPVFRRVAETSLRYLGVTPSLATVHLGDVKRDGAPSGTAPKRPPASGAPAAVASDDGPSVPLSPGSLRVPDAVGLGAHDVIVALMKAGFVPRLDGWGRAVRQSPAPGSAAAKGSSVRVVLEPAS